MSRPIGRPPGAVVVVIPVATLLGHKTLSFLNKPRKSQRRPSERCRRSGRPRARRMRSQAFRGLVENWARRQGGRVLAQGLRGAAGVLRLPGRTPGNICARTTSSEVRAKPEPIRLECVSRRRPPVSREEATAREITLPVPVLGYHGSHGENAASRE